MNPKIVVKFLDKDHLFEVFENATIKIAPPGIFIISSETGQSGMIPMGVVRAIIFPEGESKVQGVSLT